MAEWSNASDSKSDLRAIVTGVRIPLSPPFFKSPTNNFNGEIILEIDKKLKEFNKRFSITETSTHQEEFQKFRIRIFNAIENPDEYFLPEGILFFCQIFGIPIKWHHDPYEVRTWSTNIKDALKSELDEKRFFKMIQTFFHLPTHIEDSKIFFFNAISHSIDLSNVNLAITKKEDEVILYPRGEKFLDNNLVEEILKFLNPESQKHFIEALAFYEKREAADSVKSSESVRRTIEEFLKFKLKNQKGLDANIKELQSRLKQDGIESTIRNIIFQVFSYLDQYFNENSKHNDGDINEAENEFLIYQAGVLMRYIHKAIS